MAYGRTLDVPFYLDDFSSIRENSLIYHRQGFDALYAMSRGTDAQRAMLRQAVPRGKGHVLAEHALLFVIELLRRDANGRYFDKRRKSFVPFDAGIFDRHAVGVGLELD